ncbi:hypothetical protein A3Q56_00003 [Intoshia linei]|uniref:Uncharacterized protein n=1 Tax=Intoshia linei TaxID=1819745 RepID=A0A177BD12_9BILA|nr:hypothetical protein A3Q56_00003 [Intoshia linei]
MTINTQKKRIGDVRGPQPNSVGIVSRPWKKMNDSTARINKLKLITEMIEDRKKEMTKERNQMIRNQWFLKDNKEFDDSEISNLVNSYRNDTNLQLEERRLK